VLELINVACRSLDLDRLTLSWDIADTSESPLDYDFHVQRAGSPGGEWDTVSPQALVDTYIFVDAQAGLLHNWAKLYYRIRVVRRSTGEESFYPDVPVSLRAAPPLDALEMARQELVLLKEFVGRKCWLFKRRTSGAKCPECWDPRSMQRVKSKCMSCYGTGWAGGYHRPIEFYCNIAPAAQTPQNVPPVGELQIENSTAWTIFFPPVDPRDVIVEPENVRWLVHNRVYTERARAPVKQQLQIHRITPGDMEFLLPLDVDPATLDPTAVRQFHNPVNPEIVVDGLDGVFSRLGVT